MDLRGNIQEAVHKVVLELDLQDLRRAVITHRAQDTGFDGLSLHDLPPYAYKPPGGLMVFIKKRGVTVNVPAGPFNRDRFVKQP
jgi:hypothetical protein